MHWKEIEKKTEVKNQARQTRQKSKETQTNKNGLKTVVREREGERERKVREK